MNIYDYIIVGGGIAGLYANYKLSKNKKNNILLFEAEKEFGGRAYEMKFHDSLIKTGAGIFIKDNKNLNKLLKELNIKPNTFETQVNSLLDDDFNMELAIKNIKLEWENVKGKDKQLNVLQFLVKYFGKEFTNIFLKNSDYNDFLYSSMDYFINFYNINELSFKKHQAQIISWNELVNKLLLPNCKNNTEVKKVYYSKNDKCYKVKTSDGIYYSHKIIIATTLKPLDKILSNIIDFNYKDYIGTVPFVRIYTYHKNGYELPSNFKHYNIVDNELQKIIPINKNILMTSYSDNKNALFWKNNQNKHIVKQKLKELNIEVDINDIVFNFWSEGVHYYKPYSNLDKLLKKLCYPKKNIFVVGEIVSKKHGWVEGAIESVNRII